MVTQCKSFLSWNWRSRNFAQYFILKKVIVPQEGLFFNSHFHCNFLYYTAILETIQDFNFKSGIQTKHPHSTYSWNIEWQKCVRMGLNSFHIKWMISTLCNSKNQNPGSCFGATSWTALRIWPIWPNFEVNRLSGFSFF